MPLNKAMRAALAALSYPELDLKKRYPLKRALVRATARRAQNPTLYQVWQEPVRCGDHTVPVRLFLPTVGESDKVIVFFHGGGWVTGTIDTYDAVCADLAHFTGWTVAAVDYRLAPEHPFPQGLEDCYAVVQTIFRNGNLMGSHPRELALLGDSAGGNLAAAVSLMARDRGDPMPSKQILLYPATASDHSDTCPFPSMRQNGTGYLLTAKRVRDYLSLYQSAPADLENPYFAPILAPDLSHQPDTLVITAELCPLRDEGEAYARKLARAGNRVKAVRAQKAVHGYFVLPPKVPLVRKTYALIHDFLEEGCP
jgi:acetyl esterase/lipase